MITACELAKQTACSLAKGGGLVVAAHTTWLASLSTYVQGTYASILVLQAILKKAGKLEALGSMEDNDPDAADEEEGDEDEQDQDADDVTAAMAKSGI